MTELLRHASDDQLALAFCFAALAVSGGVMYFSHYVGQWKGNLTAGQPLRVADPVRKDQRSLPAARQDKAA